MAEPYATIKDLPDNVRKMSDKAQRAFLSAFNSAWKSWDVKKTTKTREAFAYETAHNAVQTVEKGGEVVTEGVTPNSNLPDSAFAWVSNEWRDLPDNEHSEIISKYPNWLNSYRKLPFKNESGQVDKAAWKSSWRKVAWATFSPYEFYGGPAPKQVVEVLRQNAPYGVIIHKDNTFRDLSPTTESDDIYGRTVQFDIKPFLVETYVPEQMQLDSYGFGGDISDGAMFVEGIALVDEAISSNGRYYSREFNDKAMEATLNYMKAGHTVTMYGSHGRAVPNAGSRWASGYPVGRIFTLERRGDNIWYQAFIVPTTEGRDMQTLIKTGCMYASSIRTGIWTSESAVINGQAVDKMLSAVIQGIDLADEPGIEDAGIYRILEDNGTTEVQSESTENSTEEIEMDLSKLTLEEFLAARKDLADTITASAVEAYKVANPVVEAKNPDLEKKLADATAAVDALNAKLESAELKVAAYEQSTFGVSKTLAEAVIAKVTKVEDIAAFIAEEKPKAIDALLGATRGNPGGTSNSTPPPATEGNEGDKSDKVTEERSAILRFGTARRDK